jgi:hypothetical protein
VITYDSIEILADFAKRQNITLPLLSDPQSATIRAFGILNTTVPTDSMAYGIPYPGTYIVDASGIVKSKYFEDRYQDRYAAPTILLREFGLAAGTREAATKTAYLEMKHYATRDVVRPNLRFTLVLDFVLPPKMHVYTPEVQGYIPIKLELDALPYFVPHAAEYPKGEILLLPAINERVPVYHGSFRITQDVTMAAANNPETVLSGNREVKITGRLHYQACDDKICYLPPDAASGVDS